MEDSRSSTIPETSTATYCVHCGAQILNEAVVCVKCGRSVEEKKAIIRPKAQDDTMATVVKVFLILGCISMGWMLIPLAWCIPITVSIFNRLRDHSQISTGLKICTLLFVSLVAGVCLLCMDENYDL